MGGGGGPEDRGGGSLCFQPSKWGESCLKKGWVIMFLALDIEILLSSKAFCKPWDMGVLAKSTNNLQEKAI